jgi:hypothetical protein
MLSTKLPRFLKKTANRRPVADSFKTRPASRETVGWYKATANGVTGLTMPFERGRDGLL